MQIRLILFLLTIITAAYASSAYAADDIYQSPESFVAESFEGQTPLHHNLAIDQELSDKVAHIMGSHYKLTQTTYWQQNTRTIWILEDIGKFKPITAGFVVGADGTLERVKVLIYRESHGWEVKHDFFTRQFKGAGLKKQKKLDQRIDGISGATLSVKTLKRLSALALLLHKHVNASDED